MIESIRKQASQDELVEAFALELAAMEPVPEMGSGITTADFVAMVVKCANRLEEAGKDAGVADEVLSEFDAS